MISVNKLISFCLPRFPLIHFIQSVIYRTFMLLSLHKGEGKVVPVLN
jgi:hypothetical protein